MRALRTTAQFDRDLKLARKRGKDISKLWTVVDAIIGGTPLHPRHRPHRLSGEWRDFRECHIEADWLLIWREGGDEVVLTRLGTHSDLFR